MVRVSQYTSCCLNNNVHHVTKTEVLSTVFTPNPCATELVDNLSRLWNFLNSEVCETLLLILATIKAAFYCLLRSPDREARELACAIAVVALFSCYIAVTESPRPQWVTRLATQCDGLGSYAGRDRVPSNTGENRRQSADGGR